MSLTTPTEAIAPAAANPRIPGPRGLSGFLELARHRHFIPAHFVELAKRHGDVVRIKAGPWFTFILVTKPEFVQYVLQKNQRNFGRPETYEMLRPALGDGLLTSEGELWKRQRRLIQPMFHRKVIAGFAQTIVDCTREMLAKWRQKYRPSQPFDVAKEMTALTLRIVGRALFSTELGDESARVEKALVTLMEYVNDRITSLLPMPYALPTPAHIRVRRAIRELEAIVYRIMGGRKTAIEAGDEFHDLLTMLMAARDDETGETMTAKQIRDEVMTFVLAGHETTSNALAWTFALLGKHPAVEADLQAELARAVPDDVAAAPLDWLKNLSYAPKVINEAIRLYPPAWAIERRPAEPDEIGGFRIPTNCVVMTSPYVVHHRPDIWPDPEVFEPRRFEPEAVAKRHPFAYFPFGGGPRLCIGREFALMEAQLIFATIAREFRLPPATDKPPVVPEAHVTLRPKHGVWVTLEPLRPADTAP